MNIKYFKKKKLPDRPGIYFFKNKDDILYIGKATSLKDRVQSYMSKSLFDMRGPLVEKMVEEADKVDFQITDSVLEALILEAALIKKYQPKYNTKEKSDKSFNYVCITKSNLRYGVDGLPKVIIVRGKNLKHSESNIFGPFPNSSQLREAMKIIRRIFPFLDEKSKSYMEFYKQINLVPDLNDLKIYLQNIKNIKLFFEGKKKKVLINLRKEMVEYAKKHEFEKAGETKRQIFALQHINDVALIKQDFIFLNNQNSFAMQKFSGGQNEASARRRKLLHSETIRIEAYDIAHMAGKNMVGVMVVVENGEMEKSEYKKFKIRTQTNVNDVGALEEVLERRLAHTEWPYPGIIVMDGGIAQINLAKKVLSQIDKNINIVSVLKDERHKAKAILGDKKIGLKYRRDILLANSEAHRFAINYHKNLRNKNFLK